MFERFTDSARNTVVLAQQSADRLAHDRIGSEHLLWGLVSTNGPVSAMLHEQGLTPDRVEAEITKLGTVDTASAFDGIDKDALAAIGIDLDAIRSKIEADFTGSPPPAREPAEAVSRGLWPRSMRRVPAGRRGHTPFSEQAKQTLSQSLRQALALHDHYIGVEHLALALVSAKDTTATRIVSALGLSGAALRTRLLDDHRKAG
ncbi:MAG TPA: Clp protease N-terminal domain-containing protein [Pseudonocardiaceae bacterium]|nr:Clp protease N-terminal domain-containing protein [Pseudonocardiaceae bacterium]